MKNHKTDSNAPAPKHKKPCGYCGGNGEYLDHDDFCPSCGAPSRAYREMVTTEWETMLDKLDQGIGS